MRSSSRFKSSSTVLNKKVDTVATQQALNGTSGEQIISDYRGISVLSSYAPMNLKQIWDVTLNGPLLLKS
jgi:hypothetical protein